MPHHTVFHVKRGEAAVHAACGLGLWDAACSLLNAAPATLEQKDRLGLRPLHHAAVKGHTQATPSKPPHNNDNKIFFFFFVFEDAIHDIFSQCCCACISYN